MCFLCYKANYWLMAINFISCNVYNDQEMLYQIRNTWYTRPPLKRHIPVPFSKRVNIKMLTLILCMIYNVDTLWMLFIFIPGVTIYTTKDHDRGDFLLEHRGTLTEVLDPFASKQPPLPGIYTFAHAGKFYK